MPLAGLKLAPNWLSCVAGNHGYGSGQLLELGTIKAPGRAGGGIIEDAGHIGHRDRGQRAPGLEIG